MYSSQYVAYTAFSSNTFYEDREPYLLATNSCQENFDWSPVDPIIGSIIMTTIVLVHLVLNKKLVRLGLKHIYRFREFASHISN